MKGHESQPVKNVLKLIYGDGCTRLLKLIQFYT